MLMEKWMDFFRGDTIKPDLLLVRCYGARRGSFSRETMSSRPQLLRRSRCKEEARYAE